MITCVYFSVLVVIIPIYADNQDYEQIQTTITVTADKSFYENGERVTIFGNISNYDFSSQSPLGSLNLLKIIL